MKRIIFLFAVIASVFLIAGCDMMAGSGVIVEHEFFEEDFKSVDISRTCDLTLVKGEEYSVVISCDDNLEPYLAVEKTGDTLAIGLSPYTNYNHITFKAYVTMPALDSLTVSGASDAAVRGFDDGSDLSIEVSGASGCDIEAVSTGNLNLTISGASSLKMISEGAGGNLTLECSGASFADLRDCSVGNAALDVSGASTAWVAAGLASGTVSGASTLYCGGSTTVSGLSVDSTSDVKKF